MTDHISLAPRTEDALSMVSTGTQTRPGLPVDLLQNVAKRLQFLCLLILAVAVVSPIVTQMAGMRANPAVRFGSMGFVGVASLAVYFIARSGKLSAVRLLQLGLLYEVLLALAISLSVAEPNWFSGPASGLRWSGVAVLIIIYPVIVPNTMRATLVASLAAAASEPAVVIALSLAGMGPLPPAGQFIGYLWPNIIAVGFAVAITKVIYGLGE